MDKYKANRYGHRARMRECFITGGDKGLSDWYLLELFLGQVIPQRDIKGTVYELQNRFVSLENIFSADIEELKEISNIGENTAMIIVCAGEIMRSALVGKRGTVLKDINERCDYIKSEFNNIKNEALVFIGLNNGGEVCGRLIFDSDFHLNAETKSKLLSMLLSYNATNCMVICCSPTPEPIETKIYFFSEIKNIINTIGVRLADAGVLSKNELILLSQTPYSPMTQ